MIFRNLETRDYSSFLSLYNSSFPEDERRIYRDETDFSRFIAGKEGRFKVFAAEEEGRFCGFLSYWPFSGFTYVEHFAVDPSLRGRNIGTAMLAHLTEGISPDVLLEVELPQSEKARRRIGFYERNGFRVRDGFRYIQPPYGPGQQGMELLLMTHGDVLLDSADDLSEMLRSVYGVQKS